MSSEKLLGSCSMAPQKVLMFLQFLFLPIVEWLINSFSALVDAVVVVVGGTFSGVVLFAALWVEGAGVVLRAEEATKT